MKALIYRRISTNDTKQDIERQKEPLTNFCQNKGFEIIGEFKDAITGSSKAATRSGYSELLKYVQQYKGDKNSLNVVFDEVSRLGRSKIDVLTECDKFTQKGINVHFINPPVTLINERGEIDEMADWAITIYSQAAQSELRTLKARIKSSIPRTLSKNHSLGGIELFGYKNENKRLVIDEDEAKIVQLIFKLYLDNTGTTTIANYLNSKGIPTRKKSNWKGSVILRMLKNKQYKGVRVVNGEEYIQEELRLVSDDDFDKVQENFKNKSTYKHTPKKNINPLIGIIKCECGSPVHLGHRDKLIYKCTSVVQGRKCNVFSQFNFNKLNNVIYSLYNQIILDSNTNKEYITKLEKEKKQIEEIDINIIESDLSKYSKRNDNIIDLVIDGMLSKQQGKERQNKLKQEEKEKQEQLNNFKERIKEIDKQISVLSSEKKTNNFDLSKFKIFCQDNIKRIIIQRTNDLNDLPEYKSIFRPKEVIIKVTITTLTNKVLTIYTGNFTNYLLLNIELKQTEIKEQSKVKAKFNKLPNDFKFKKSDKKDNDLILYKQMILKKRVIEKVFE